MSAKVNGVLRSFATGQMCSNGKQPLATLPFEVIVLMRVRAGK